MTLPTVTSFTALTAVGVTAFQSLDSGTNICFQATVASIGTNVVVRLSGSLDGTNFFNLHESDITITANGTYGHVFANTPVLYVRCELVSISTGTPTVTFKVATSN